jgi:hypothetical protein
MTDPSIKACYVALCSIGQAADEFCRKYSHHQFAGKYGQGNQISLNAPMRDIAYQIEHACRSLSPEALQAIANR